MHMLIKETHCNSANSIPEPSCWFHPPPIKGTAHLLIFHLGN